MSNNLPIYPLLRPGRDVDVIIAFDASADVKEDNWVKVVDGYARQRGIKGWPMGAGWPPQSNEESQTVQQLDDAQADLEKVNQVLAGTRDVQGEREDLGFCNVWVGSIQERQEYMDEPPSRRVKSEEDERHLMDEHAGVTLIYLPFIANDKVPGVDPMKSDFMSTWNFVYTPEEIDKVVALARANYEEGKEQTRRTIRAIWQRKKMLRLQRNEQDKEMRLRYRFRDVDGGDGVGHWDHFSGN
jgi:phospholipase A2